MRALIVFFLILTAAAPAAAQTADADDLAAIRATVEAYFDGMIRRDRAALDRAFHPEARLIGAPADRIETIEFDEWATYTAEGYSPRDEGYDNRIVMIDVAGNAAVAKVDLAWPKTHYVDYLTLLETDGRWRIVNKTWFEEPSPRMLAGVVDLPLPESERRAFVGRYSLNDRVLDIREIPEGLTARLGDQRGTRMLYQGDAAFVLAMDTGIRLEFEVEGPRAVAVRVSNDEGEGAVARRIEGETEGG